MHSLQFQSRELSTKTEINLNRAIHPLHRARTGRRNPKGTLSSFVNVPNRIETNRFDDFCTEYNTPNQGYGGFSCHMSYCFGARRLESHVMMQDNRSRHEILGLKITLGFPLKTRNFKNYDYSRGQTKKLAESVMLSFMINWSPFSVV